MVTVVLSVEAQTEWGAIASWSNQPPPAAPNTIQKLLDKLIDKAVIDRLAAEFLTSFLVDVLMKFLTGSTINKFIDKFAIDKSLRDKLVILR